MRLLVISHTAHYRAPSAVAGWGPTVREIDHLAGIFDEVRHLAPLHSGSPPPGALPYARSNVRLIPVSPAGGESVAAKLGILKACPGYLRAIRRELGQCDAVHVRCPANISLLALLLLFLSPRPKLRWVKYAGNWAPTGSEPLSYRFQRWLLRRGGHGAVVTVNGAWPNQPPFVRSFLNPCLTDEEIAEGRRAGDPKVLASPIRLLFVGRLDEAKGCGRVLEIMKTLSERGVSTTLDVVGGGPEEEHFASQAAALGLGRAVRFVGWQSREALAQYYARAHFLLLPSTSSEGWPKVLSEAMAYGAIPLSSDVSSIPQYLRAFQVGRALPAEDREGFVEAVVGYAKDPRQFRVESRHGMLAAERFSYVRYVAAVRDLFAAGAS